MTPLTVSINTASEMLGVSVSTLSRLIRDKKLRATKIERRVLIRVADLNKMLDAHPA